MHIDTWHRGNEKCKYRSALITLIFLPPVTVCCTVRAEARLPSTRSYISRVFIFVADHSHMPYSARFHINKHAYLPSHENTSPIIISDSSFSIILASSSTYLHKILTNRFLTRDRFYLLHPNNSSSAGSGAAAAGSSSSSNSSTEQGNDPDRRPRLSPETLRARGGGATTSGSAGRARSSSPHHSALQRSQSNASRTSFRIRRQPSTYGELHDLVAKKKLGSGVVKGLVGERVGLGWLWEGSCSVGS